MYCFLMANSGDITNNLLLLRSSRVTNIVSDILLVPRKSAELNAPDAIHGAPPSFLFKSIFKSI